MPKRKDIKRILVIGSGPIVIGQACEFDYSGTQACKALREEGFIVILINSNPATIMTDPEFSDRTYIEPLHAEAVTQIIEQERPDALLPTLGGQTSLNLAVELAENGTLEEYGVELIGAKLETIKLAEDRELFRNAMREIGLNVPPGGCVHTIEEARDLCQKIGFPLIIRPAFTLGGIGGSVVYNKEEFDNAAKWGLSASPVTEILMEQSVLGWKEYELEVMRDGANNFVIVCSIENFDPMGIHTGDSITVAPAQTLTDVEYQNMRDAAKLIVDRIGVETGGANIQFALNPATGEMIVVEMNPRVSRSSALASKATGFPIAKIAAKLAVGYRLHEIPNDITRKTPASFEPAIDYVVAKIPRWDFEKFPDEDPRLTSQMKSIGEAMGIGRTFKEALNKTLRSLENGWSGFHANDVDSYAKMPREVLLDDLRSGTPDRILKIWQALKNGISREEIAKISGIDRWFLENLYQLTEFETKIASEYKRRNTISPRTLAHAKRLGFSDKHLALLTGKSEGEIRSFRKANSVQPSFKIVDTCAAEFESFTPYYYSTYDRENESTPSQKKKVIILGGGPNRIGQGIEFDYCCVHGILALKSLGIEAIMINCNPETVSTDYDVADKLYFEPLTYEDVLSVAELEKPDGVIIQFGGQTPLKLALPLEKAGVPIWGTSPDSIDLAEDRDRFGALLDSLDIPHPQYGTATSIDGAMEVGRRIGFPLVVRPSYVLGGRAMEIVYDIESLKHYMQHAVTASEEHPVLLDRFLEDAYEFDVDAISDGEHTEICGIMQHIEEAGVHSGDSMAVLPPFLLSRDQQEDIREYTRALAGALKVKGLINIQFAVMFDTLYVIEVNPRASRTVPFVSKTTGIPIAKIAVDVMAGKKLDQLDYNFNTRLSYVAVKESVFPFDRFGQTDIFLRPEMRSTGEVMGIAPKFGEAVFKAFQAAGITIPKSGTVFLSVNDNDKARVLPIAEGLRKFGYHLVATQGTAEYLSNRGIAVKIVLKIREGRPNVVDDIKNGQIDLIINTPLGQRSRTDEYAIGWTAITNRVPFITTLSAAEAIVRGLKAHNHQPVHYKCLQDYYKS
ncbi:MAG: carbamoyl-phosphate synthase large subunit [Desulfobacteraceae bacterium]|jgi:carbamoyl-phosphate synthase large subunit|nr:carbamoyl-phosphate synthase large subunit [Desulfobacteraceae bacterium]